MRTLIMKIIFIPFLSLAVLLFGFGSYVAFTSGGGAGGIFGGIIFGAGAIGFAWMLYKMFLTNDTLGTEFSARKAEYLKANGQKILTEFQNVARRWNFQVNGEPPIIVYTKDASGKLYQSYNIWESKGGVDVQIVQMLQNSFGQKIIIPVYVDPQKPKHYFIDLSAIASGAINPEV